MISTLTGWTRRGTSVSQLKAGGWGGAAVGSIGALNGSKGKRRRLYPFIGRDFPQLPGFEPLVLSPSRRSRALEAEAGDHDRGALLAGLLAAGGRFFLDLANAPPRSSLL